MAWGEEFASRCSRSRFCATHHRGCPVDRCVALRRSRRGGPDHTVTGTNQQRSGESVVKSLQFQCDNGGPPGPSHDWGS